MITEPCHIHNSFDIPNLEDVRNEVCKNLDTEKHTDDNYYCLLHLPDVKKNKSDFQKVINERENKINKELEKIKNEPISEEDKERLKEQLHYDFRYVFFPQEMGFNKKVFEISADFGYSTFSRAFFTETEFRKGVNFTLAKFTQDANFNDTKFFGEIYFNSAVFWKDADFSKTRVNHNIYFNETLFKGKANFVQGRFNYAFKNIKQDKQQKDQQASFHKAKFFKDLDFRSARFFQECSFRKAEFIQDATFRGTKFFKHTSFKWVKFKGDTYFDKCRFIENIDFGSSIFASNSDIFFRQTICYQSANFEYVTFAGFLTFESNRHYPIFSNKSFISFQNVRNEKSAQVTFNQIFLRPCWFIGVDATNYVFNDVKWRYVDENQTKRNVKTEIKNISRLEDLKNVIHQQGEYTIPKSTFESPISILKITCRQLATNAENNNRFEEASMFRGMAMDCEKLAKKKLKQPLTLHWWYWLSSFYGEVPIKALMVLLYLVFWIFPTIYFWTDFQTCQKEQPISISLAEDKTNQDCQKNLEKCKCKTGGLYFEDAILHSLTTATLQNTEYRKSISFWAEFWTILEKIFAPLQAALLALAIRRKFMR